MGTSMSQSVPCGLALGGSAEDVAAVDVNCSPLAARSSLLRIGPKSKSVTTMKTMSSRQSSA